MSFVVDASVGVKWVLDEPDSNDADALLRSGEVLLLPDFWLNEATNVLWTKVRRRLLTAKEARKGIQFLQHVVEPTSTDGMRLHDVALEMGLSINHSPYDTLYLAFAQHVGARALVLADRQFVANVAASGSAELAAMMLPLDVWAAGTPSAGQ